MEGNCRRSMWWMYGRWSSRLCSASSTEGDIVVKRTEGVLSLRSLEIRSVSRGRGSSERGVSYSVRRGRARVVRWW